MFKKSLLILLGTNLCAAEEIENPRPTKTSNTSFEAIGIGVAAYVVYTIIPKIEGCDNALGKGLATVAGTAVGLYGVSKLYTIASGINEQNVSSDDKKARINLARQKNDLFAARKEFKSCLMKNIKTERNDSGRPVACEDLASIFAMIAGKSELDQMTTTFNDIYRN